MDPVLHDLDALVVGAGFAGLYELHHLRSLGLQVKIYEEASDVGGVWYWNRYPGARVDSVVPVYEYQDEVLWRDFSWKERYPDWTELRRYFQYVDQKLDLRKDIVFNRRVVSATWSADENRWLVTSQDGSVVRPRFLLLCVGYATRPYIPSFEGMSNFKGQCHHTARWPQEGINLRGKRVAVIGTGASGVQVVQDVGPEAAQLTVFQRTPNIAFPMRQKALDEETSKQMKRKMYEMVFRRRRQTFGGHYYDLYPKNSSEATPEERYLMFEDLWSRYGGLELIASNFKDIRRNQEANSELYAFWRSKVLDKIKDREVQDILAPKVPPHAVGAKRPSLEMGYFETFNLASVELVDLARNSIVQFTENGILTEDGRERDFDVIVLATGFHFLTGGITAIDLIGTDGMSIGDKWAKGVRTYLGMMSCKHPNMFFMYGVHAPTALANGPSCIEAQGEWINGCIKDMMDKGLTRIEPLQEAEEAWFEQVEQSMSEGLFEAPTSVFMGRNIPGQRSEPLLYVGGLPEYVRVCREKMERGYEGCTRT